MICIIKTYHKTKIKGKKNHVEIIEFLYIFISPSKRLCDSMDQRLTVWTTQFFLKASDCQLITAVNSWGQAYHIFPIASVKAMYIYMFACHFACNDVMNQMALKWDFMSVPKYLAILAVHQNDRLNTKRLENVNWLTIELHKCPGLWTYWKPTTTKWNQLSKTLSASYSNVNFKAQRSPIPKTSGLPYF